MAYWQIRVPFEGTASIAMQSDEKPKFDEFRALLHRGEFDTGLPQYFTQKAEIEEIDERIYDNLRRLIKRKASISKIANSILGEVSNG